jgi:N-acetylmuramoyl-L-alanine amidase
MASSLLRRSLAAIGLSAIATAAVGCQSGRPAAMVDRVQPTYVAPEPSRPVPAPPVAPPPPPVTYVKPAPKPLPLPTPPVPQPGVVAGIPRDWVPTTAVRKWDWIVIHHSATPVGGAARFGAEHKAKGWDELGYHFVIGNGTDTGNGQTEVGTRWPKQKQGAHCRTPNNDFNERGIGICLVGNFDTTRPSDAQLKAVAKLVAYLQKTYKIPASHVIGHGDAKATECPGKNLHVATVRSLSARVLADAGDALPPVRTAAAVAGREMLVDNGH